MCIYIQMYMHVCLCMNVNMHICISDTHIIDDVIMITIIRIVLDTDIDA
jgi:hypothetical protein